MRRVGLLSKRSGVVFHSQNNQVTNYESMTGRRFLVTKQVFVVVVVVGFWIFFKLDSGLIVFHFTVQSANFGGLK